MTMLFALLTKLGFFVLVFLALLLSDKAHAASAYPTTDIVYSGRYYKPGTRPSYYKIWRISSNGSGRVRVTRGTTDDHSPVWLADGRTILFVQETASTQDLCTVDERGGPVTKLARLPKGYVFIEGVAPNRRMVVYLVDDSPWRLVLFNVATLQERSLGVGYHTAWSPDSLRLYVTIWEKSKTAAHILDLTTGNRVVLTGDLRAAVWLGNSTLVAEEAVQDSEQARLVVLNADGTKEREVTLPFTWDKEDEDLSPFADKLFAIPEDIDSIIYARHADDSTGGPAHVFYRVNLKGGEPTVIANGRDLSWSSDHQSFATGGRRDLARLDRRRKVWVSPLSIVSLKNGEVRPLVRGLVSVGGFDWKPLPKKTSRK